MIKILVIADDFTGALDTGVHFSMKGAKTLVSTQTNYLEENDTTDLDVLVIDTETRYVDFNEAYTVVSRITSYAQHLGIPYIYKKTDSALRGNVSAEIKALADQSNDIIPFLPAFQKMVGQLKMALYILMGKGYQRVSLVKTRMSRLQRVILNVNLKRKPI